jgi:hypothetical protein
MDGPAREWAPPGSEGRREGVNGKWPWRQFNEFKTGPS